MAETVLTLRVRSGELHQYHLAPGTATLGRAEVNSIVVDDPRISRQHARLEIAPGRCHVVDLGSANGLRVEGRRVPEVTLGPGDTVEIGDSQLSLVQDLAEADTALPTLAAPTQMTQTLLSEDLAVHQVAARQSGGPRLIVHSPLGTEEFELRGNPVTIGRSATNDIVLDLAAVSREHLVIEQRGTRWVAQDRSSNGTFMRGRRIDVHTLNDGDTLVLGEAQVVFRDVVREESMTLVAAPSKVSRRPVVIVPGVMGSELWRGSDRLWPNVKHLIAHPGDYLLPDASPIVAGKIVEEVVIVPGLVSQDAFGRLGTFLREELGYLPGEDYFEFPYDWRLDLREAAKGLYRFIDELPVRGVTIVAHSMGNLVSRYCIEVLGRRDRVERLIMLGGPHRGSLKSLNGLLTGKVAPLGPFAPTVRRAFVTYPSAYMLLPRHDAVFDRDGTLVDAFAEGGWQTEVQRPLLDSARRFHRELGLTTTIPAISIFGYGLKTPSRMEVERDAHGRWGRTHTEETPIGDTAVIQESAVLPGSEIHPVHQFHGALYVDSDVKVRLKYELVAE